MKKIFTISFLLIFCWMIWASVVKIGLCRTCYNEGEKTKLYRITIPNKWTCSKHK